MNISVSGYILFRVYFDSLVLLAVYFAAVYQDQVYFFLPYISDAATKAPQCYLFGFSMTTLAFTVAWVHNKRYEMLRGKLKDLNKYSEDTIERMIKVLKFTGIVSSILCASVGLIQIHKYFYTHYFFAITFFTFVTLNVSTDAMFTAYHAPVLFSKRLAYVRLIISVVLSIATITSLITMITSFRKFDGPDFLQWKPTYQGYFEHVLSAVTEWVSVYLYIAFLYTFKYEFTGFRIDKVKIF